MRVYCCGKECQNNPEKANFIEAEEGDVLLNSMGMYLCPKCKRKEK